MLQGDELDDLDVVARELEQAGASGVGDLGDEPLAQRPVPQQRSQHVVVELAEQLVLAARHGEDDAGAAAHGAVERRVRRGVAGVEADDEIDVVEVGLCDVADLERQPCRVQASCERFALGHDVGLDVEPEEIDLDARGGGRGGRGART